MLANNIHIIDRLNKLEIQKNVDSWFRFFYKTQYYNYSYISLTVQ